MPLLTQNCPICNTCNWEIDQLAGQMLGLPSAYNVFFCKTCGQRRLSPQLSEGELKTLYSDVYFNSAQATLSPEQPLKVSSNDYISTVAPGRHSKFLHCILKLKQLHPDAATFLDVGAATGDMVKIALDQGLIADGIEFSDFAVRKAKELYSIDLQQTSIADLDNAGYYDLIHLNHVFEHFNDPVTDLGHLNRLLKPGGGLYIEIPFQFHPVEKLLFKLKGKRSEFSLHSLHHPYFYTPNTIRKLLQENGFEIVICSVFDPARYPTSTFITKAKLALWWLLSVVSIGNYIEVFARRKA